MHRNVTRLTHPVFRLKAGSTQGVCHHVHHCCECPVEVVLISQVRPRGNDLPGSEGLNPSIEHFARILCRALLGRIHTPNLNVAPVKICENEIAWSAYRQIYQYLSATTLARGILPLFNAKAVPC